MGNEELELDLDRLEKLRIRRGLSKSELSKLAGFNRGHFRRIGRTTNLTLDAAIKLARGLGVDLDYFIPQTGPRWTTLHSTQSVEVNNLLQDQSSARSILTCTQGMESYMQADEMVEWTSRSFLETNGWELADHKEYIKVQRRLREKTSYVHRILCRREVLASATKAEAAFVGDLIHRIKQNKSHTLIGFVDNGNWISIESLVKAICPLAKTGWDKLTIADDYLAVVRTNRFFYHYTYHGPTVVMLRDNLDRKATIYVPYAFPMTHEIYHRNREDSVTYAIRLAEKILRSRP
jgi:hypothetical protein